MGTGVAVYGNGTKVVGGAGQPVLYPRHLELVAIIPVVRMVVRVVLVVVVATRTASPAAAARPAPPPVGRLAVHVQLDGDGVELAAEVVVEPTVQEGVDAGGAHGEHLEQQVDELKVRAAHQDVVDLRDEREDVPGQPAEDEEGHDGHQDLVGLLLPLTLRAVQAALPEAAVDLTVQQGGHEQRQAELEGEHEEAVGLAGPRTRPLLDAVVAADVQVGLVQLV